MKKNWEDIGSGKVRHKLRIYQEQKQREYQQQQQSQQPQMQTASLPTAPTVIGGSDQFTDPITGKKYYGPTTQYAQSTQSGVQIRQSTNAIWLNGNPAERNKPTVNNITGIATIKDAQDGRANWNDVEVEQRKTLLSDPKFYQSGQINKYPKWMQQQILADPSFDWQKLPKWQRYYYELSSSPASMGAAQGGLMGLGGGPIGGAIGATIGAGLGYAAAKSGYDPTKEAWQQKGVTSTVFGGLNFLAEQAEKTIGIGIQAIGAATDPNVTLKDVFSKEGWNAGAVTFETLAPAYAAAVKGNGKLDWGDLLKIVPTVYIASRITDLMLHPEKYKGEELILGSKDPLQLDSSFQERITQARDRISKGENYRVVAQEFQNGVMGQLGDMAGQAVADPLNVLPETTVKVGEKIADVSGNKVAATALAESKGLGEAARRYKTLVQTGQAQVLDPKFKVDTMGAFSRFIAGVTEEGTIKAGPLTAQGLLEPKAPEVKAPKFLEPIANIFPEPIRKFVMNRAGFVQEMLTLTPQARAQIGAGMFYENIGSLLTMFDDPHEAGKYLKALANSDMETWSELGSRFADSPEFYTVLPALKDYNTTALEGLVQGWDATSPNRDMLTNLANILGDQPAKLLDDLASRGTAQQDFERIVSRLQQSTNPNAKAILDDIQAGRFTPENLSQIVDVFSGEGAAAWHPAQWKAQVMDSLGTHFDEWVTNRLMLDQTPEAKSAFFRTAALMKQAQSILLLGGSPGYAIQNGLSNMVHRAATGIYGYLSEGQITGWMERFGATPARFEEGVGIGGIVENVDRKTGVVSEAQAKAIKGEGKIANAKDALSKISRGMPFNKLSSWFEKNEGRQAYAIAMRQFWSQSWRRDVGFRGMSPELVGALQGIGVEPSRIYAAVEASMSQAEIEKHLFNPSEGLQSRSLVDNAARNVGLDAKQAADILEKIGVMDELDNALKGKDTRGGVVSAFERVEKVAQETLDRQTGDDLKAIAEHVKQKVGLEGAASGLDVVQRVNSTYFDAWMDHFYRLGEVMQDLGSVEDQRLRSKLIDNQYAISDAEFRRINQRTAAYYQGIFDAWGLSKDTNVGTVLSSIGEADQAMKMAYDQMREIRKKFFDSADGMDDLQRSAAWSDAQAKVNEIFEQAFAAKNKSERRMGVALGNIYEQLYGKPAAGAARSWWNNVVKFNQEIVKRERVARAEFAGMPKQQREAAKAKYYRETKIALIAEAERINQEWIGKLEQTLKTGVSEVQEAPKDFAQAQQEAISQPRSKIEPAIGDAIGQEATRIADVISGGEPGRRTAEAVTSSTYPDWYNELQRSAGGKKKLLDALEKIQRDHSVDKGKVVERVKAFLLDNIQYGDEATGQPPNLSILQLMGADEATLQNTLNTFNDQMNTDYTLQEVLLIEGIVPDEQIASMGMSHADELFANANLPVGALDQASQFIPHSEVMDQGWSQFVRPLMDALQDEAVNRLKDKPLDGSLKDLGPEGQAALRRYIKQVQNDMATSKLSTMRWGESQRDFAMLNYSKQYGFDRWLNVVYPYQFFYTRSLATWGVRGLDAPAWYSNYARQNMQQNRYERDIPERLRNKIKIPAPWLPDWAGNALYIDPIGSLFTPSNFLRPFERMQQDRNYQEIEAERILQEWAKDGTVSDADLQAAMQRKGPAWERAFAEAQMRREAEIANPMDFFSTMFGPAWYLSTPLNLAGIPVPGISKGDRNKVRNLPLTNTARALDTVTQGTWAEPIGNLIGLIGKPEEWARKKLNLPTMGEYGEYYTKRQVANMVAEGLITSEQASLAMIEKQGDIWDQATQRVQMELALRVPTMSAVYAGLHEGPKGLAQASLPSLFGSGLLPAGELEYRGLKQEWNEAWARKDYANASLQNYIATHNKLTTDQATSEWKKTNPDQAKYLNAISDFFDEHPEYEAYLAKGKSDDELMKSFMIGQIWDGYMSLGPTDQKQARAEMGSLFSDAFLNKETRSYDSIDRDTLLQWAQMFNKQVPQAVNGQPLILPEAPKINYMDPNVTRITDEFFNQRSKYYPDYYEKEQGYYALPKNQRGSYLLKNPDLKAYWDWKKKWFKNYPDLQPVFKGQVFKRIDTSTWAPGLLDYVTDYAYAGKRLPKGAMKALEQQWILEGKPYDNLKTWLNSQVVPALLYGGGQP